MIAGRLDSPEPGVPDLPIRGHRDSDRVEDDNVDVSGIDPRGSAHPGLRFPLLRELGQSRDRSRSKFEFGPKRRDHFELFAGLDAVRDNQKKKWLS